MVKNKTVNSFRQTVSNAVAYVRNAFNGAADNIAVALLGTPNYATVKVA